MIELCRQPESSLRCRHDSIYIHQFCIVEGKQKKGYGTYFMEEIERFAKSLGFEWLELDYWAKNEGAEKFYDQFGFEPVRTYVRKRLTD
jgi:Acetyltransferase (GNAT) family.